MSANAFRWDDSFALKERGSVAAVGAELARIRKGHGGQLPIAAVVETARSEKSALHPFFEWDEGRAAHAWRLRQARELVRAVVVVVDDDSKGESANVRTFARPEVRTRPVRSRGAGAELLVERAWEELLAWRSRYGALPAFAAVVASIDRARREAS